MATKTERASLSALPFTKKASQEVAEPEEAAVLEGPEEPPPIKAPARKAKPNVDEKVVLMVRVSRSDRKKIRQIAVATDTTVQALVEEAVKDIVRRHRVRS